MHRLYVPPVILRAAAILVTFAWVAPARAVDYFWVGPDGGAFRVPQFWQPFSASPPFFFGPGGSNDTANFNRGVAPASRYTVVNVHGANDRLLIRNDSLALVLSDDYTLLRSGAFDGGVPSLAVGLGGGDTGDVIFTGSGVLRAQRAEIRRGTVWIDDLQ